MFFLNKVRNELTEELENAKTDKEAVDLAKHINDLTNVLEDVENFNNNMDDYINYDLFDILHKKRLYQNTIWYKKVCETNNGFDIKNICMGYINEYKLEMIIFLNRDFDLGCVPNIINLDGTLH
jgi:hypothetical protein